MKGMIEKTDYTPGQPDEEDAANYFSNEDALLTVDRSSNRLINRYPTYKVKQVAIPLRNKLGKIERDQHGRPVIDRIENRLVFQNYKQDYFNLPGLVDPNVPKSQLRPNDYPFIMRAEKLIGSIYMFQFKEGIPMTNAILFFSSLLKKYIHYKRAYAGYGGRLSKSNVHYYYADKDESAQFSDDLKRKKEEVEIDPQTGKKKVEKKDRPVRMNTDYLGTSDVDFGRMRL